MEARRSNNRQASRSPPAVRDPLARLGVFADLAEQVVAVSRGWTVVATYADEGISGAKGREARPGSMRC
jgi:hypothetical protein